MKTIKKYQAKIKISNIRKHLGYYESEIEAAKAYNNAALELHGEFSLLNDIPKRGSE